MKRTCVAALLLIPALAGSVLFGAEEPLVAGSQGVPVPRKIRHVDPRYPPQAMAEGVRGIVVIDLVIDVQGNVSSVSVVRGVPGLDEAAIAAARQWRFEPVIVDGRPVSVRLTVPMTFALPLPGLERAAGIPELRQGRVPVFPETAESGTAVASVTLEPDGRVSTAVVVQGVEPWAGALLDALRTWRFTPPPDDIVVSFRVEADFVARDSEPKRIELRAAGLRQTDLLEAAHTASAPAPQPTAGPGAKAEAPAPASAPEPPIEVVTVPPPAPPPESGISAVRDVTLEPGVPELARGRRPVPPPLARMASVAGTVEVSFSVGAAGSTTIRGVAGPDLLKDAAEQAVASWVFQRTRADRAYLVAVFSYGEERASAVVRPQAPPTSATPERTTAPPPAVQP